MNVERAPTLIPGEVSNLLDISGYGSRGIHGILLARSRGGDHRAFLGDDLSSHRHRADRDDVPALGQSPLRRASPGLPQLQHPGSSLVQRWIVGPILMF